jgi:hypothetical protein
MARCAQLAPSAARLRAPGEYGMIGKAKGKRLKAEGRRQKAEREWR